MLRALERQRSLLDFLKGDLGRLSARIPAARRGELKAHLEGDTSEAEAAVVTASRPMMAELPLRPEVLDARKSANHSS